MVFDQAFRYHRTFLLLAVLLFGMILGSGCSQTKDRSRVEESLQECLINVSAFPKGWVVSGEPGAYDLPDRVLPGRAKGGVTVEFYYPKFGARAYQDVFLYQDEEKATKEFERRLTEVFDQATLTPWKEPQRRIAISADTLHFACAQVENITEPGSPITVCTVWARYGPMLTEFSTWQSPAYMNLENLARVVHSLDEQMKGCKATVQQESSSP